jgi:hypothetical protein
MSRSTKEAWLTGPGDLKEADVENVPADGMTVRVRGLSARYSAEIQGQLKLVQQGREQVAKIDVAAMELLQFVWPAFFRYRQREAEREEEKQAAKRGRR